MNREQRKYIQARVVTIFESKKREIGKAYEVPQPFKESGSRAAYIQKVFSAAGIPFTYTGSNYSTNVIETDVDVKWKEEVALAKVESDKALAALNKLRTEVMDEVMLGADAEAMTASLAKLESFKVE